LCGGCGLVVGKEKQDATHHGQRRWGCSVAAGAMGEWADREVFCARYEHGIVYDGVMVQSRLVI